MNFDYATSGEKVPAWFWGRNDGSDFGSIFVRGKSEEEERKGFFLSPRLAFKLFGSACYLADNMRDSLSLWGTIDHPFYGSSRHPRVCKKFFRQQRWVDAYIECYDRVAARLAKV